MFFEVSNILFRACWYKKSMLEMQKELEERQQDLEVLNRGTYEINESLFTMSFLNISTPW